MLFNETDSLDAVWNTVKKELQRAALDKKHPFRFVMLSSSFENRPDARYVVLRKTEGDGCCYIYTDSRSQKVFQLAQQPACTLLFYHPQKRCQVKIQGRATIHRQDPVSKSHWANVQGEAQKAYQSSLPPGTPIENPAAAYAWEEATDSSYFTVIAIQAETIECLQLNGLRHLRAIFRKEENDWSGNWLAP